MMENFDQEIYRIQPMFDREEAKFFGRVGNTFQRIQFLNERVNVRPNLDTRVLSCNARLSKKIQVFDCEKSSIQAKEWLETLNGVKLLHQWPLGLVFEAAPGYLKTLNWFRLNAYKLKTWKDFEEAFTKIYISAEFSTVKWRRMAKHTQQKGESLNVYFMDKAGQVMSLSLEEAKERILIGLRSKNVCNTLSAKKHKD